MLQLALSQQPTLSQILTIDNVIHTAITALKALGCAEADIRVLPIDKNIESELFDGDDTDLDDLEDLDSYPIELDPGTKGIYILWAINTNYDTHVFVKIGDKPHVELIGENELLPPVATLKLDGTTIVPMEIAADEAGVNIHLHMVYVMCKDNVPETREEDGEGDVTVEV